MMIVSCLAHDGSLVLDDSQKSTIKAWLTEREGKTVYLVLSEKRPPRTLSQNAYYHGVIVKIISDYTGDDPESTHEQLKSMYCPRFFDEEGKEYKRSTTRLSTKQFTEYIDRCIALAAEYGISLPTAEDV